MAIFGFGQDEEEQLGIANLGDSFSGIGTDGFSGLAGKKNDPLATSWDNFKIQFGGGLQTLDDILNKDSFLSQWGEALEESGEIGKEDYLPLREKVTDEPVAANIIKSDASVTTARTDSEISNANLNNVSPKISVIVIIEPFQPSPNESNISTYK